MDNSEYVHVPQNDKQQIEQVVREYESEPAKGIAHGVQKDAIQNAFGARIIADELKSCKQNWGCTFELISIDGADALIFWDQGTTGLSGDILSVEEIERKSSEELLGKENPNQKLARFLTRFESGGNLGPGSFGRGKLIFQGASKNFSILVDSYRSDDNKYIAFDRKVKGTQLIQRKKPFEDIKAKEFIRESTGGALKPLSAYGTRITILNVKDEIADAYKKSFIKDTNDIDYNSTFSYMIEETWWEILEFGANISMKMNGKVLKITLSDKLKSFFVAKDKENGMRVYEKKNISVVVDSTPYKIKHLKFVVAAHLIDEDLREIWVQRKRMKIGSISRGITVHHKIQKHFIGYIILESELEKLFEEKESTTHYSFDMRGGGGAIGQVRSILKSHIEEFHKQLGYRTESVEAKARQDMLETLKELNEQALKLGLPTEFSSGTFSKDVEVSIDMFVLPNPPSTRIEIGDKVGPVIFRISNNTKNLKKIRLEITSEQRNKSHIILKKKDINLKPLGIDNTDIVFKITKGDYLDGEGMLLRARIFDLNTNQPIHQVSRMLWIGMNPPEKPVEIINITSYLPLFPRLKSRRVELTESIKNIHFKISNNVGLSLKVNLDLVIRKAKSPTHDVRDLIKLIERRNLEISALSEKEFAIDQIEIKEEIFGGIFGEPLDANERKCEIYFSVRAAENYHSLNINIGEHLGAKKIIPFYCGIDPAGMSIFKSVVDVDDKDDGRRSWIDGDRASGYTFKLNVGHNAFILANENGNEFRKYFIKEQMLFQAYVVSIGEKIFKGPAEEYENIFLDDNLSPIEGTLHIDKIVGKALHQIY
jgi:hypothetical protein